MVGGRILVCCEGFVGAVGSWTSIMSPAEIACQSWSITCAEGPVPNVENAVMSAASSTSSPTPPTKTVRFDFVPSSMWPKGGSGRENVSTFRYYRFTNDGDGPEGDASSRQAEQTIQAEAIPKTSAVSSRPAEAAVHLVVRPD
jgi:hypothetical protein